MSTHKTTKGKRGGHVLRPTDHQSLVRYADLLKLRSLAHSTQADYLRYVRRLGAQAGVDPATLTEEQVRAHILRLKTAHAYSPSSMRTAVAALSAFYNLHLGNAWKLFSLVRSPDRKTLPVVLTRQHIKALFAVVREERFRAFFTLAYACGLRIGEGVSLRIADIEPGGRSLRISDGKGGKDRLIPLPNYALQVLRAYWKTHRNPVLLFPSAGRGRTGPSPDSVLASRLAQATEPMCVGSVQNCLRRARVEARLPEGSCVHALRHSYATHLLEEGVSIRLISAYLGHSSLETTAIYLHLTAVNEAGARAALDRLRPTD